MGRRMIPMTSLARSTGPTTGRATTTSTAAGEIFLMLLTARRTGHSSGSGRASLRRSKRSDCSCTWSRSSRCRNSHALNAANSSLREGSRQAQKETGEILHSRRKSSHSTPPQQEEPLRLLLMRQWEPGRLSQLSHSPAAHVWLAGLFLQTANSQKKEVTASVTASGHESGKGD